MDLARRLLRLTQDLSGTRWLATGGRPLEATVPAAEASRRVACELERIAELRSSTPTPAPSALSA